MKLRELIEAQSKYSFDQRRKATDELEQLWNKEKDWTKYTNDDVKRARELVKIAGRKARVILSNYPYSAGHLLDVMIRYFQKGQQKKGVTAAFDPKVSTLRAMADQIALHTNGEATAKYGRTFTAGPYAFKDPSQYVEYKDKDAFDDAVEWIQQRSKPVYYREKAYSQLLTAYKIGKFLISDGSAIRNVFSKNPQHYYALAIQSASTLRNRYYDVQDIIDQEAARIKDIADTKNATALEKVKLLIQVLNKKDTDSALADDLDQVEALVKKASTLNAADKAKIQAIISSAKDFKEPKD